MPTIVLQLAVLALNAVFIFASHPLGLPQDADDPAGRQEKIDFAFNNIRNEPRGVEIDGDFYPLPNGPVPYPGSLAANITQVGYSLFLERNNPDVEMIAQTLGENLQNVQSMGDYLQLYEAIEEYIPIPQSAYGISDEYFGQEQLTIKGLLLRRVRKKEDSSRLQNTEGICGLQLQDLVAAKRLFINDVSFASDYNDPSDTSGKYTPATKAYFCVTQDAKFLPVAIHVVDTDLVYFPTDSADDWTLAKMAHNAGAIQAQAMEHFVRFHLTSEIIRVEMFRTMSIQHPIYALLEHHFTQLFGNTVHGVELIFTKDSIPDQTWGWSASGLARITNDRFNELEDFSQDYEFIIKKNGLRNIPNFKRWNDMAKLQKSLGSFVYEYLKPYYKNGSSIKKDHELQKWVIEVRKNLKGFGGFSGPIETFDDLVDLIQNIISRVAIEHHAWNSDVFWNIISAPYSSLSLWHPMPLAKGQAGDLMQYVMPGPQLVSATLFNSFFKRPMQDEWTLGRSYQSINLGTRGADSAVQSFIQNLDQIENEIEEREVNGLQYTFLKPSRLPYYCWI